MNSESEPEELEVCPTCGEDLYHAGGGPALFCDSCEMEYWREYSDGVVFRCGPDGIPEVAPEGSE